MATDDRTDVLVIGAGASGAAVAWRLAGAGIGVVCLEQGDWVDARAYPHWRPDWELHRQTDWSAEPNVRRLPQDYPVNDRASPISPLMYTASPDLGRVAARGLLYRRA
jgi:choline dehydrogenase-like flavoprotein